jgi:hypothetical protein
MKIIFQMVLLNVLILPSIIYSQVDGSVRFSDNTYSSTEIVSYFPGTTEIYMEVYDPDKNLSTTTKDTLHITLFSSIELYGENFTLLESGNNTDLFRSAIPVETNSPPSLDGILQANRPDTLVSRYVDELNGFGNPDTTIDNAYLWIFMDYINGYTTPVTLNLTKLNSPYFISGGFRLWGWVTFNIEPGVEFKFFPNSSISYRHSFINAIGTQEEPIVFTSVIEGPVAGYWNGFSNILGSNVQLKHCILENATIGISGTDGIVYEIDNCIIRNCSIAGISTNHLYATPSSISVYISKTIFEDNDVGVALMATDPYSDETTHMDNVSIRNNRIGVFLNAVGVVNVYQTSIINNQEIGIDFDNEITTSNETKIKFNNCYIANNGQYDVRNLHNISQNFRFNFWGDSTTNEINLGGNPKNLTRIYDYYEDPTKGLVNYSSWRNSFSEIYPIPFLISPEINQITNSDTVNLGWDHIEYPQFYRLEFSTDSLFQSIVYSDSLIEDSTVFISNLTPQTDYYWRVKSKNLFGEGNWSEVRKFNSGIVSEVTNELSSPITFRLNQNFPNPFNPSTKINYSIPERSNVSLKVFDLLGSEIVELVEGEIEAGIYEITFNASILPSGIYFYKLQAGSFVETKKMILLK